MPANLSISIPANFADPYTTGLNPAAPLSTGGTALGDARDPRVRDVVLIAGKGHETYQIIGDQRIPFDDHQVAREAIEAADRWAREEVRRAVVRS